MLPQPRNTRAAAVIAALFSVPFAPAASAQEQPRGFVAFGLGTGPDFERSEDYDAVPLLAARVATDRAQFEFEGLAGRIDLSQRANFGFGPAFRYRFGRDDGVDNAQVAALPEIDDAFEVGFFLRYGQPLGLASADEGVVRLDVLQDVADGHSGFLIGLSAADTFRPTSALGITTGLSTRFASDDYAETYFSVSNAASAASGLSAFDAGSGFDSITLPVGATYQLTDQWGLIANASVGSLLGDAADSPIVSDAGSETQAFLGLGVTYSF